MVIKLIMFICVIIMLIFLFQKSEEKRKIIHEQEGILVYSEMTKYLGGFADIYGQTDRYVIVKLKKDKLILDFKYFKKNIREIDIRDIINIYTTTNEQISNEISLGRLVIFGLYGLGMAKKNKEVKQCLVITCKDSVFKQDYNILLESAPSKLAEKIIELKRNEIVTT